MTEIQAKLNIFFKQYATSTFPKNHVLVSTGQPAHFFYFIETGAVKMTHINLSGDNLTLHIFFPKAFFSLLTLISQDVNEYDFVTLLPTTVRKVPKNELVTFLQANNDVLYDLHLRLLRGLNGLLKRIEQASLSPAHSQVASLLLYFAAHFSKNNENKAQTQKKLAIKITHQEISDWLGLSRENVSIQMKLLEQEGLIEIKNRLIEIPDSDKLKEKSLETLI